MNPKLLIATVAAIASAAGVGYWLMRRRARVDQASRERQGHEAEPPSATSDEPVTSPAEPLVSKPSSSPAESPPGTVTPSPSAPAPDEPPEPTRTTVQTPLPEPTHPALKKRINQSHENDGTVSPSPEELLAQARRHDPTITLDELAGARLAASEHSRGSFTELAAIIDAELNRAEKAKMSLFDSLTRGRGFGAQAAPRPASTRLDPRMCHLLAAREVLSGRARGVSRGAVRFFDPRAMERQHRAYRAWIERGRTGKEPRAKPSCDALDLLEVWSFDYPKTSKRANRCPPNRSRTGSNTQAWVGEIPGIDATKLMLMAPMPLGLEHLRRYGAARALLREKLAKK